MTDAGTLHGAFLDALRNIHDAERQLTGALDRLAKAASSPDLRDALETHLDDTLHHVDRLERVFEMLDETPDRHHCQGIAGIIEESTSTLQQTFDEITMDACLIAAGRRMEHYEMAAYDTLIAWAQALGHSDAADLLHQTFLEEKAADEQLSRLAADGINQSAAWAAHLEREASAAVGARVPTRRPDASPRPSTSSQPGSGRAARAKARA